MRRLVPLALLVAAAGCGSTKHAAPPPAPPVVPASPAKLLGAGAHVLYAGGDWAVVTKGTVVVAAHRVGAKWRADHSTVVKIDILGPKPNTQAAAQPQVAAAMKAPSHLIEEGLWIDGHELLEKGGGLTPESVTVYGAPDGKLKKGRHVAIAYGRTDTHGSAVAWTFTVV